MLSSYTIIDLSRLMPGPFCTMLLADLGARVIQVEPPETHQDVTSTSFPSLTRNKEQMVLDLKSPRGLEVFFRLVESGDAVVEGFRPGTLDRLGASYPAAAQRNPAIVYCSITGYGQTGDEACLAGHDVNFLAISGILNLMSAGGTAAAIPALQFADMTGSMMGAIAVLAALHESGATGKGRHLDISMTDAVLPLAVTSLTFMQKGWPHKAGESLVGGGLACYGLYKTSDNGILSVGALEAVFFRRLCGELGLEELIPHQYSLPEQPRLRHKLAEVFASKPRDEWLAFFADKDVCVRAASDFDETVASPRFSRHGAVRKAMMPDGEETTVLGMPIAWPGENPPGGSIPTRGQHTDAILTELGYTTDEITTLRTTHTVR